jgi:hypothetical protein
MLPRRKRLLEATLNELQVFWMNSGSPIVAADFFSSLGQAVDGRIARRNLHPLRGDVERKRSNQGELASEGKLQVALGQRARCLFPLCDVARNPKQLKGPAIGIAQDGAFDRYPALLMGIRATASWSEAVFDRTATSSTLGSRKSGVQCR